MKQNKEKEADEITQQIIDLVAGLIPENLSLSEKVKHVKFLSDELARAYCSIKEIILED